MWYYVRIYDFIVPLYLLSKINTVMWALMYENIYDFVMSSN